MSALAIVLILAGMFVVSIGFGFMAEAGNGGGE